ncbi:hypothetical protein OAG24_00030 [bacterium]|nr:hypothetical protein [bacterium]
MTCQQTIYPIIIIAIAILIFAFYINNRREYYGGIVKNIRRLPANDCRNNCLQYYKRCMYDRGGLDAGQCDNRYQNCLKTCYYTDFQRM